MEVKIENERTHDQNRPNEERKHGVGEVVLQFFHSYTSLLLPESPQVPHSLPGVKAGTGRAVSSFTSATSRQSTPNFASNDLR